MRQGRKPRKNYRKDKETRGRFKMPKRIRFGLRVIGGIAAVALTTVFFTLVYDLLTQCDYFRVANLTIDGMGRLSRGEILQQARVHAGANVLAVNLATVRKRLLAHPWIAEAAVSREIPGGLRIRIKEHVPLAIVDLGDKFLMNQQGEIFKEWTPSDPADLPVIIGLDATDLPVCGLANRLEKSPESKRAAPYDAVMQVLRLGGTEGSIMPNGIVRQIRVDRQIGLTLFVFDQARKIVLGYNDYAAKYHRLAKLLTYLKSQQRISDFDRIYLNNLNRVVVNPIKAASHLEGS